MNAREESGSLKLSTLAVRPNTRPRQGPCEERPCERRSASWLPCEAAVRSPVRLLLRVRRNGYSCVACNPISIDAIYPIYHTLLSGPLARAHCLLRLMLRRLRPRPGTHPGH